MIRLTALHRYRLSHLRTPPRAAMDRPKRLLPIADRHTTSRSVRTRQRPNTSTLRHARRGTHCAGSEGLRRSRSTEPTAARVHVPSFTTRCGNVETLRQRQLLLARSCQALPLLRPRSSCTPPANHHASAEGDGRRHPQQQQQRHPDEKLLAQLRSPLPHGQAAVIGRHRLSSLSEAH